MIKLILCLKHKTLVPTLHFSQLNPAMDLEKSPFFHQHPVAAVDTISRPKTAGRGQRLWLQRHQRSHGGGRGPGTFTVRLSPLALSSGGPVGPEPFRPGAHGGPAPLLYRDRGCPALPGRYRLLPCRRAAAILNTGGLRWPRIWWIWPDRLSDLPWQKEVLSAVSEGAAEPGPGDADRFRKVADRAAAMVRTPASLDPADYRNQLLELAQMYVKGVKPDFAPLWQERGTWGRVGLPVLPLFPGSATGSTLDGQGRPMPRPWLHPLVHENRSGFQGLGYGSRFRGEEFFFADHKVKGSAVMPAAALLEMARAARGRCGRILFLVPPGPLPGKYCLAHPSCSGSKIPGRGCGPGKRDFHLPFSGTGAGRFSLAGAVRHPRPPKIPGWKISHPQPGETHALFLKNRLRPWILPI